jgi:hypothetical protein
MSFRGRSVSLSLSHSMCYLLLWTESLCPLPPLCWSSNLQCDSIWKWGIQELIGITWVLMGVWGCHDKIFGLIIRALSPQPLLPQCEHRGEIIWGLSQKFAVCKSRRKGTLETKSCGILILNFPDSRTVRKLISVGQPCSIGYCVMVIGTDLTPLL